MVYHIEIVRYLITFSNNAQAASFINAAAKVLVPGHRSKKLRLKKVPSNCAYDLSKFGSVYVKALKPIKAKEEYLLDYGLDALRLMFGLPMPGNKRLRGERGDTEDGTQSEMPRDRQKEKRRAVANELGQLEARGSVWGNYTRSGGVQKYPQRRYGGVRLPRRRMRGEQDATA